MEVMMMGNVIGVSQNTKNKRREEQVRKKEADSTKVFVLNVLTFTSFHTFWVHQTNLHSSSSGSCQIGSQNGDDRRPQDLGLAECVG
jgi:hypothetical protein